MIEIRVWRFHCVWAIHHPTSWEEARELYLRLAQRYDQYTELLVDGKAHTTAQAWRYFKVAQE